MTGRLGRSHGCLAPIRPDRLPHDLRVCNCVIFVSKLRNCFGGSFFICGEVREILAIEFQYLMTLDVINFDVTITGFEVLEIDLILQEAATEPGVEEVFEPATGPAISEMGDLWILGKHRILCGNSLDSTTYVRRLED